MKNKISIGFLLIIILTLFFATNVSASGKTSKSSGDIDFSGVYDLNSYEIKLANGGDADETNDKMVITQVEEVRTGESADKLQDSAWNLFYEKYKGILVGMSGVCTLTFVAIFLYLFVKLGLASTNPQDRSSIQTGMLWAGIAGAGFGSVTVVLSLGFGVLSGI